MKNNDLINLIGFIRQLGKLSLSLSILFLFFFALRGINIFTNYERLLIVIGVQLFIILICNFFIKKLNKS
jgi:hypothetical protein